MHPQDGDVHGFNKGDYPVIVAVFYALCLMSQTAVAPKAIELAGYSHFREESADKAIADIVGCPVNDFDLGHAAAVDVDLNFAFHFVCFVPGGIAHGLGCKIRKSIFAYLRVSGMGQKRPGF